MNYEGKMIIKWTKKLKEKFGGANAKNLYVKDKSCLKRKCFQPHDWYHDGHLVCLENAKYGCPANWENQ